MHTQTAAPSLEAKVAFLADPAAYPGQSGGVDVVETHMSWVFLTAERAYKLKKPIRRDLIDFTTADARYANCLEEVRLNRRLGGATYLGVKPLKLAHGGRLGLGGEGTTVDWLVTMRRLPRRAMLDQQIRADRVDWTRLQDLARKLARFYLDREPVYLGTRPYLNRLGEALEQQYRVLQSCDLPADLLASLRKRQLQVLESRSELFAARDRDGMVVEAHGDLRPEHVCLTDPPVVIDCLEFNRDLRIQDRADELSFLAMEAEKMGSARVGDILLAVYSDITGDRPAPALLAFYRSRRALLRARLSAAHLEDDPQQKRGNWLGKAREYLRIAEQSVETALS